jgi:hypothetical protein
LGHRFEGIDYGSPSRLHHKYDKNVRRFDKIGGSGLGGFHPMKIAAASPDFRALRRFADRF